MPIITLTTDFGIGSPYVAQMKASILLINPQVRIVDITHAIPPQDIVHAARVLAEVTGRFPPASVHVVVVDPGVGTNRNLLFARIGEQNYVAPDNGVLSALVRAAPPSCLISLTNRQYWLDEVSSTFHGRDVMAPVAAHLASGVPPSQLGEELQHLVQLDWPEVHVHPRRIEGSIVLIDSFGNLITDISADHLRASAGKQLLITCGGTQVHGLSVCYQDHSAGTLIALVGSSGHIEIAIVNGNAAKRTGLSEREAVVLTW